jgi:hypothetical protein
LAILQRGCQNSKKRQHPTAEVWHFSVKITLLAANIQGQENLVNSLMLNKNLSLLAIFQNSQQKLTKDLSLALFFTIIFLS